MKDILDAIVIGAGPSGLGASLALSGYRPHHVPACAVENPALQARLRAHVGELMLDALPNLAAGLRGRSNNPLALLFDALQHPGVDSGVRAPSCLELRLNDAAALSHVVVDPAPFGGSWHSMHDAVRTLSPGPWMELPGLPLSSYLTTRGQPAAAAAARQPRRLIAEYYEVCVRGHPRPNMPVSRTSSPAPPH